MCEPAPCGLEATPVGDALCLFWRDTGALGLLNGAARKAWEKRGPGAIDMALPRQPMRAVQQQAQIVPSPPPGRAALDVVLAGSGRRVGLRCHEPWLADLLAGVLSPLLATGEPEHRIDIAANATGTPHLFNLWRDGGGVRHAIPRGQIRRRTLVELALALHGRQHVAALLHASAIGFADGAVLLAGRSGAGKSSLMAGLVAAGGGYMGDDLIPLHSDGRHVHGFATALSVKSGSWARTAAWFPTLYRQPVHAIGDQRLRYLPMPGPAPRLPVRVRCIVFPSYEPGADFALRTVRKEEAFALLIDAGSEIVGTPASANPLVRLAETVPAVHLAYGDLQPALDAILALAAGP